MMELVDMQDLKSCGFKNRTGSTPVGGTEDIKGGWGYSSDGGAVVR